MGVIGMVVLIIAGGVVGGIISSIAGGASIVSYPVLLLAGVPPLAANVTNHGALIFDYLGAIASSRRELAGHWRLALRLTAFAAVGAVGGTFLLLAFPATVFERVVPVLLVLSGLVFLPRRHVARAGKRHAGKDQTATSHTDHQYHPTPRGKRMLLPVLMLAVGCYTGYFGGANGVVVLAVLQIFLDMDFLTENAIKNVICAGGNCVAFAVFVLRSTIYWREGLLLAAGMLVGGFVGPALLRHVSVRRVRVIVAGLAFLQAACLAVSAWG